MFSCLWPQLVKKASLLTTLPHSDPPRRECPLSPERPLSWWHFGMANGCSKTSISNQGKRCRQVETEVREQYQSNTAWELQSINSQMGVYEELLWDTRNKYRTLKGRACSCHYTGQSHQTKSHLSEQVMELPGNFEDPTEIGNHKSAPPGRVM